MPINTLRYGIMGGTFDPIHIGHLVVADEIREKFNLDKVIFIPTGNPPHKDSHKVTESKHRYEMVLLATSDNSYFEASSIEIDREGITYTIDTIIALKEKYNSDIEFYFITGADAILELSTWKMVDKLLSICKFIAATRPGFDITKLEVNNKELTEKYRNNIFTTTVPLLDISSTDIRRRVIEGRTIKYLLPKSVEDYIMENKIYRE